MVTSEFIERLKMINNYFLNNYKWKPKSDACLSEYQYYKGYVRNLEELKFITGIIFPDMNFYDNGKIFNTTKQEIGAYIVGTEIIHPNINGIHQSDSDSTVYLAIGLCQFGMFIHRTYNRSCINDYLRTLNNC